MLRRARLLRLNAGACVRPPHKSLRTWCSCRFSFFSTPLRLQCGDQTNQKRTCLFCRGRLIPAAEEVDGAPKLPGQGDGSTARGHKGLRYGVRRGELYARKEHKTFQHVHVYVCAASYRNPQDLPVKLRCSVHVPVPGSVFSHAGGLLTPACFNADGSFLFLCAEGQRGRAIKAHTARLSSHRKPQLFRHQHPGALAAPQ